MRSRASDGDVAARTVSPTMRAPHPCDRADASVDTRYRVMTWMTSWTRIPHFICASDLDR